MADPNTGMASGYSLDYKSLMSHGHCTQTTSPASQGKTFAKNRDGCGLLLNNGKMEIDRCQHGQWLRQQGMVKQSRMGKVNVCLEVNVSAVYFGEIP